MWPFGPKSKNENSVAVQVNHMQSAAEQVYAIMKIGNGWLLVRTRSRNGYEESPAIYHPDLKSLYEGMVAQQARDRIFAEPSVTQGPATGWSAALPSLPVTGP